MENQLADFLAFQFRYPIECCKCNKNQAKDFDIEAVLHIGSKAKLGYMKHKYLNLKLPLCDECYPNIKHGKNIQKDISRTGLIFMLIGFIGFFASLLILKNILYAVVGMVVGWIGLLLLLGTSLFEPTKKIVKIGRHWIITFKNKDYNEKFHQINKEYPKFLKFLYENM